MQDDKTTALAGVLWSSRGAWLTLREVSLHKAHPGPPTPLDGEVTIHRDNIAFIQVLPS